MRNKIYCIVEGHGEAGSPSRPGTQPAVYVLTMKLLQDQNVFDLFVPSRYPPWRMRGCGDIFRPGQLEDVILAHRNFEDCAAILVLVDMDERCPFHEGPSLVERIRDLLPLPFSVVVVCAKCEYESWFLASLESIHEGQTFEGNPEGPRDAKGWLKDHFGYSQVRDQADYTRKLDIELILLNNRSRSFQRLYHAFEQLIEAYYDQTVIITP